MDKENWKQYEHDASQLHEARRMTYYQLDNTMLFLAAGGIALSVAGSGNGIFFGVSVLLTLISFLTSGKAIDKQLEIASRYYLDGEEDAGFSKNWFAVTTEWLNYMSLLSFSLGLSWLMYSVYSGGAA